MQTDSNITPEKPHTIGSISMISGTNKTRPSLICIARLIVLCFLFNASFIFAYGPSTLTLESLMESRKSVKKSSAIFKEEKNVGAFKNMVVMEGKLYYQSPNHLIKQYTLPDEIRYETDNSTIIIEEYDSITEQKEKQRVKLDRIPMLNAFITALRGVLSGNIESVKKLFDVTFSENNRNWLISLTPREEAINKLISTMVIGGKDENILLIEINERSGDSTITKILSDDIVKYPVQ